MRIQALKFAAALALGLVVAQPAQAQALRDAVASIWSLVSSPFQRRSADAVTPPTPINVAKRTEVGHEFWDGLKDAGYELREISTVIGIIPEAKMDFQLVRELSDADRDALERRIEIDEIKRRGVTPALQRQILRTLLAASNLQDMRIMELKITLFPLPSAEFVMEPIEAPLSEEHSELMVAIEGHSQELRTMSRGMNAPRTTPKVAAPTLD
jgi:hypothetical protein